MAIRVGPRVEGLGVMCRIQHNTEGLVLRWFRDGRVDEGLGLHGLFQSRYSRLNASLSKMDDCKEVFKSNDQSHRVTEVVG